MILLALLVLGFGWSVDRSPGRLAAALYITELSRSNGAHPLRASVPPAADQGCRRCNEIIPRSEQSDIGKRRQ
ncbi:hypothetical protein ACE10Z_22180 [Bradyrhizobium sp. Pha-3]|uniref:hypothetical protein n=1 Tax=Bradyrhizobium sp. Pha-3 TaxID=208375 RepID=UPI0035D41928